MALTKARPPVTEIDLLESGTTTVEILSAGGNIDVDVTGLDVLDLTSTTVTVDDLVQLIARRLLSEQIDVQTAAGAQGEVMTDASRMQMGTTSLHPLDILMNGVAAMIVNTNGQVQLASVGDDPNELVDKNYVDNVAGVSTSFAAILGTAGEISIPTDQAQDLEIKWGKVTNLLPSTQTRYDFIPDFALTDFSNNHFVTFFQDYNNGFNNHAASTMIVDPPDLTGFSVIHPGGTGSLNTNGVWLAIGN